MLSFTCSFPSFSEPHVVPKTGTMCLMKWVIVLALPSSSTSSPPPSPSPTDKVGARISFSLKKKKKKMHHHYTYITSFSFIFWYETDFIACHLRFSLRKKRIEIKKWNKRENKLKINVPRSRTQNDTSDNREMYVLTSESDYVFSKFRFHFHIHRRVCLGRG